MKITFLLPVVSWAGGIRVIAIYAKWLAAQGHTVTLVSQAATPPSWRRRINSLVRWKGWIPYRAIPDSHINELGLQHIVCPSWRPPSAFEVPAADVLVCTWWETAEWAQKLPADCGTRVYFIQGHEIFDFVPKERCEATYRMPYHKIVVSKWLKDLMTEYYKSEMVDLVPNAVDHSQFFAPPRGRQATPTVGFIFSETSLKGFDITLEALEMLKRRYPDLKGISFGSKQPTGRFKIPRWIDLSIAPSQESLRELYSKCDVWLSSSRSEGFNLIALEAMACRTPLVSTRTGWPLEAIVNGDNGFLVNSNAIDCFVNVSKVLDLSVEAWREMSASAFETVRSMTWEASCVNFEKSLIYACKSNSEIDDQSSRGGE